MTKDRPIEVEAFLPLDCFFSIAEEFADALIERDEEFRDLLDQDKPYEAYKLFEEKYSEEFTEIFLQASMKYRFLELLKDDDIDGVVELIDDDNLEVALVTINKISEEAIVAQKIVQKLLKQSNEVLEKINQKLRAKKDD